MLGLSEDSCMACRMALCAEVPASTWMSTDRAFWSCLTASLGLSSGLTSGSASSLPSLCKNLVELSSVLCHETKQQQDQVAQL